MKNIKLAKEERIKEEVIEASRQLFKRFGYMKTTMEDIARATGRGKSTLYYYYNSKEDIFESIVLIDAMDFFSTVAKKVERASSAEEKLKVYILTAYQVINEKAVLNDVILNEMLQVGGISVSQPSMMVHLSQFNQKWSLTIKDILIWGVENNEFSKSVFDELDAISQVLMASLVSVVLMFARYDNSYQHDSMMPVPEVLVSLANILINGLKYKFKN